MHLRILGLELFQSNDVADVHAGVFRLPKPDRVDMNPVFARKLFGRHAGIILAHDIDDLRLGEAALAHGWISFMAVLAGNPQLSLAPDSGPIPVRLPSKPISVCSAVVVKCVGTPMNGKALE